MQRHGIGRQVQRSSSGSTPHDRVTIPQICLSRSLVLDQPRQSALRYPAVVSNRPTIRSVPRHPPLIHHWLQRRPTSWIGPKPITQFTRDTQIPIAHAALSRCPPAVSSLGGLRKPAPVRAAPPSWGQHPKTFTEGDIKVVDPPVPLSRLLIATKAICFALEGVVEPMRRPRRPHDLSRFSDRKFRP